MSFDRSDIGGWLNGPEAQEGAWPGKALGYPQEGPGSVAPFVRRLGALIVDWLACLAIANVFFHGSSSATLWVFAVEQVLLVGLTGTSLGHRLFGIHVAPLAVKPGQAVGLGPLANAPFFLRGAVRSLLLVLFVPAILMNSDLRGLNDRVAGTIVLKR